MEKFIRHGFSKAIRNVALSNLMTPQSTAAQRQYYNKFPLAVPTPPVACTDVTPKNPLMYLSSVGSGAKSFVMNPTTLAALSGVITAVNGYGDSLVFKITERHNIPGRDGVKYLFNMAALLELASGHFDKIGLSYSTGGEVSVGPFEDVQLHFKTCEFTGITDNNRLENAKMLLAASYGLKSLIISGSFDCVTTLLAIGRFYVKPGSLEVIKVTVSGHLPSDGVHGIFGLFMLQRYGLRKISLESPLGTIPVARIRQFLADTRNTLTKFIIIASDGAPGSRLCPDRWFPTGPMVLESLTIDRVPCVAQVLVNSTLVPTLRQINIRGCSRSEAYMNWDRAVLMLDIVPQISHLASVKLDSAELLPLFVCNSEYFPGIQHLDIGLATVQDAMGLRHANWKLHSLNMTVHCTHVEPQNLQSDNMDTTLKELAMKKDSTGQPLYEGLRCLGMRSLHRASAPMPWETLSHFGFTVGVLGFKNLGYFAMEGVREEYLDEWRAILGHKNIVRYLTPHGSGEQVTFLEQYDAEIHEVV